MKYPSMNAEPELLHPFHNITYGAEFFLLSASSLTVDD